VSARTVAVLGLGAMGGGMATALLAAGFAVVVHNRTEERARPLLDAGATWAATAAGAVTGADVVLLSLSDEEAVDTLLFGEAVDRIAPGTTVVDASTVSPAYARHTAARLAASGARRVEVAVVGNPEMAAAGRLRLFTAGDEADADAAADVLAALGADVRHLGGTGRASTLKLALNLLLGVQTAALAEAVAFAEASGLERETFLDVVDGSGWRSPVLAFRGGFMRTRRYTPAGFRTALMRKDLELALDEAAAHRVELPLVELAAGRFADAVAAGRGDQDAAAVVEVPVPARPVVDPLAGRSVTR
jgi:3-hydroxyisobutyrate dehydrogenase-like beta-hydroxyacid dehydrogenase